MKPQMCVYLTVTTWALLLFPVEAMGFIKVGFYVHSSKKVIIIVMLSLKNTAQFVYDQK